MSEKHRLVLAQDAILPTIVRSAPACPKPFPDLDDAALTQAVCFALDKSAESGTPVSICEFKNLL